MNISPTLSLAEWASNDFNASSLFAIAPFSIYSQHRSKIGFNKTSFFHLSETVLPALMSLKLPTNAYND